MVSRAGIGAVAAVVRDQAAVIIFVKVALFRVAAIIKNARRTLQISYKISLSCAGRHSIPAPSQALLERPQLHPVPNLQARKPTAIM
jgi:hypothetical protein